MALIRKARAFSRERRKKQKQKRKGSRRKAIMYGDVIYASMIEVAWAAFFDRLGIRYQYESTLIPQADGTLYPPDFYLPDLGVYVECKGKRFSKNTHEKIRVSAIETGRPFVLAMGSPNRAIIKRDNNAGFAIFRPLGGSDVEQRSEAQMGQCRQCGGIAFYATNSPVSVVGGCGCKGGHVALNDRIKQAAREEIGEGQFTELY